MKRSIILIFLATMSFFGYSQDWFGFNRYQADNKRIIESGNWPEVVFMGNSITDNWAYFHPNFFSSNNDEVWIDNKLLINNANEVKRFSRHDSSMALAKGLHSIKIVFCGNITGGWPTQWDDASVQLRKSDAERFLPIKPEQLFY